MPSSMTIGTPSGQVVSMTYGPPSAHIPPTSITARIPRKRRVIPAATPAMPTR